MSGITTHVLDTARGRPAESLRVTLEARDGDGWTGVGGDGALMAGVHRLTFATGEWFEAQGVTGFYPEVVVVFRIEDPSDHYHVPLLLSPYAYSTYRGS